MWFMDDPYNSSVKHPFLLTRKKGHLASRVILMLWHFVWSSTIANVPFINYVDELGEGLTKCHQYFISSFSKLTNECFITAKRYRIIKWSKILKTWILANLDILEKNQKQPRRTKIGCRSADSGHCGLVSAKNKHFISLSHNFVWKSPFGQKQSGQYP